ncbi:MAG: ATP-dependent Clp protease proteolytic subunit, partial [Chloroflexota bacterium]|nr:ATP-dependent Clp protease proteolytic subunit [Chloroflexota bacterium]
DRILFIGTDIGEQLANSVVAQLLFLEANDSESDIYMYINSRGGSVTGGLAIYDTMCYVKPDICTMCYGMAASMASTLLCAGTKGKRFILPNAEVMIHQPLGGFEGQVSDMKIRYDHIENLQKRLYNIYCEMTGKDFETIKADCDRDNFMSAEQAIEYGLVDEIKTARN